jgi:hypothetical protein
MKIAPHLSGVGNLHGNWGRDQFAVSEGCEVCGECGRSGIMAPIWFQEPIILLPISELDGARNEPDGITQDTNVHQELLGGFDTEIIQKRLVNS